MMSKTILYAACGALIAVAPTHESLAKQHEQGKNGQQQVEGKVKEVGQARVAGAKATNTIVLLETKDGKRIAVDLAEGRQLANVQVKEGVPIQVQGTLVDVQGKPVFMASRVTVQGKSQEIKRSKPSQRDKPKIKQLSGTISKIREVGVKGADAKHKVGIVQVGNRKLYVDFGPTDQLGDLTLEQGSQVRVKGIAVRVKGRAILLAQKLMSGDRSVDIERQAIPASDKMPPRGS